MTLAIQIGNGSIRSRNKSRLIKPPDPGTPPAALEQPKNRARPTMQKRATEKFYVSRNKRKEKEHGARAAENKRLELSRRGARARG